MISDLDASLSALLRSDALKGTETKVVFDSPTTEWAARRGAAPVVNAFLYDIREDVARRDISVLPDRDESGRITGRRPGMRYFKLSYLLTVWTKRPEDEHRLLGQLLEALLKHDRVPKAQLRGRLRDETVVLGLALPPAPDRSLTDLWSALGGEMKPSIDLVAVAPIRPARDYPIEKTPETRRIQMLRRHPGTNPSRTTPAEPGDVLETREDSRRHEDASGTAKGAS